MNYPQIRMAQTNSLLNCKRANLRPPPHNAQETIGLSNGVFKSMMAPSTVAAARSKLVHQPFWSGSRYLRNRTPHLSFP